MTEEHITQALAQYQPTDATIAKMSEHFGALEVTGIDDRAGLAKVHAARMEVRGLRVRVEKTRKELKKDALEYGKRVDGEAKRITALLLEVEEPLAEKESIVAKEKERLEAIAAEERKAALQLRLDAMSELGVVPNPLEVQAWTDEEYQAHLVVLAQAHLDHIEEQERRKADEAIAAQELAEEREKLRVEREALEAADRAADKALAEERALIEADRKVLEEMKARVREEQEKANRAEEIKEAKEQAVLDAKIREGEEQAAREAEEAELDRLRPQYEKVKAFARAIGDVPIPAVDCQDALIGIVDRAYGEIVALAPTVKAEEVPE